MKLNINTLVRKMDGPARAIIEVEVTDLKPNEKFDQSMVNSIALGIYEQHFEFFLQHADFFGHQTFRFEIHFKHEDQELIATVYPCYTDNF